MCRYRSVLIWIVLIVPSLSWIGFHSKHRLMIYVYLPLQASLNNRIKLSFYKAMRGRIHWRESQGAKLSPGELPLYILIDNCQDIDSYKDSYCEAVSFCNQYSPVLLRFSTFYSVEISNVILYFLYEISVKSPCLPKH